MAMDIEAMSAEARAEYVGALALKRLDRKRDSECASYYATDNPDIMGRKKLYATMVEESPVRAIAKENRFAANERVASSFFRDITDQKVQYLAGEGADVAAISDEDADAVAAIFNPLKRDLRRMGQACLTDALVYRVGYAHLQIINNAPKLTHFPYEEVEAVKDARGNITHVARFWKAEDRKRCELHTASKVYAFELDEKAAKDGGEWKQTEERWQIQTMLAYGDGSAEAVGGKGWARVPWFELKQNNECTSSLTNSVKTMIRCYDIVSSDFANNLIDVQDVFVKLKDGYGSGMESGEILEMLRIFKASEEVEGVQTLEVPHQAREALLTRLETSIYKALRGVNLHRIAGGNNTATAIRALYSDVDLWADQAEWHLEDWVSEVLATFAAYLGTELPPVDVTFTRRMIFDESAQMDAIARQKGIVSDKTLFENHPLITDAQAELERVAAQELDAAYSVEL